MLFAVVSIAGLYYNDRQQADCLRRYNEAAAAVSRTRAQTNEADWAALDGMIRNLASGKPGAGEIQNYLSTRDNSLKSRAEHPLVPPPSDYCS